ncbi:MAG TPA: sigma 54-interacting transcriptional regulator [Planctomycetota bacterium]
MKTGQDSSPVIGDSANLVGTALLAKRMAAQLAISRVLSQANTLREAIPEILREIAEALGWEIGILWRVDTEAEVLVCEEIWSSPTLNAVTFISKIRDIKLERAKGLAGRVWVSKEAVWVDDYVDQDIPGTVISAKERIRGAACVPIKLGDQVLGAMEFISWHLRQPDPQIHEMMAIIATEIGLFMERSRAQAALDASEARYRLLADTSVDVLVTVDDEGTLLFANKAAERVFGYTTSELLGKNLSLIIPEHSRFKNLVLKLGAKPAPAKYVELSGVHKNGRTLHLEAAFAEFLGTEKLYATGIIRDVTEHKRVQNALQEKERKLQSVLASGPNGQIVAEAPAMLGLLARVKKAAASYAGILIQGETGSGKECVALALHRQSPRADKAFVARNCSAIPANLFESEMFGHKKGSFTGADRDRKGAFMEADGGTLFLDEIGDLEYGLQTKLLRAIQEKVIRPVGSDTDVPVDPRIICATNKDLREACKTNEFREDLYYRLVTVVLVVPPLRERREDIIPLARHFVGLASKWSRTLTPEAEERLLSYAWPGNVRELRSLMEQAVIFAVGNEIRVEELNFPMTDEEIDEDSVALADVERRHILRVLKANHGNRTNAARALGLARSTLVLKLKSYNYPVDE